MAVKHMVLALLARGPAHGYRLRRDLAEALGRAEAMAPGRLYGVLAALRDAGLAAARNDVVRGRMRRVHEITAAGRAELVAWLARPPARDAPVSRPLLVEAALAADAGLAWPPERLRAERAIRERQLGELHRGAAAGPFGRLADERRARHLEVELWLLERLAGPGGVAVNPRTRGSGSR